MLLPGRDRWRWRLGTGLIQGPAFHVEIGPGVDLGALDIGMAQEVSDHDQRIVGLQQVHPLLCRKVWGLTFGSGTAGCEMLAFRTYFSTR